MTNEELAIEIQNGNKLDCVKLWEQIEHFVKKSAFNYYNALRSSDREYIPDAEDFISGGYIAMLEVVKYYAPDKGYRYITYLSKTLKKAFATVQRYASNLMESFHTLRMAQENFSAIMEETEKYKNVDFTEPLTRLLYSRLLDQINKLSDEQVQEIDIETLTKNASLLRELSLTKGMLMQRQTQ